MYSCGKDINLQAPVLPLSLQSAKRCTCAQSFGKMGLGPRGGVPARPWGQRIGSNDKHNEWKLFIGQVPLEVRLLRLPHGIIVIHPTSPASGSVHGRAYGSAAAAPQSGRGIGKFLQAASFPCGVSVKAGVHKRQGCQEAHDCWKA